MIACIVIPGFELRAALRARPGLELQPAALAPEPGKEPLLGSVTAAAEAAGVKPGMRLGEALATCPSLVLVEEDPSAAEQAWEQILRRLEDAGIAPASDRLGSVYFDTRGVERLYGGVDAALRRALAAVGSAWDPRAGAAQRRFAALAAANVARPGQALVVADNARAREFLAPLPLGMLPLADERREELSRLGVRTIGGLAGLPGAAVAERLGQDGRRAWGLARGEGARRVRGRRPPAELMETLAFPEAVGNELTLRRALAVLIDRLLGRPERGDRFLRKLALSARLAGGGSWRRTATLRDPTVERPRLKAALGPKLAELPAPVTALTLEAVELTEAGGRQLELVKPEGNELRERLGDGLRQVRASTGGGSVYSVVEIAPWSRLPERRALLVPRDD
jgi:protein ImuB